MGTFSATHSVTYTSGSSPAPQGPFPTQALTDGDADTTFEIGDTVTAFGDSYTYEGTVNIDGQDWPVFTYDPIPTFSVVFMDQAPIAPPATYTANAATFNGACFAPGTMIGTPGGDKPVEALRIGDEISNAQGGVVSVRWIGVVSKPTAIAGLAMQAVRIEADAFGDNVPSADLIVTADHGMILDGLVINASALVNGSTIAFIPLSELPNRLTYYHVETENHDVILANGAPAETFIDYVGREAFDNHAEYLDLYGCERIISEMTRPRVSSARMLPEAIRTRLGTALYGGAAADVAAVA